MERKRALVLDDMEFSRLSIKTFLLVSGFDVDTADNGLSGLKCLSENKYDLIFSDIEMPNMNGLEFLKRVKTNSNHKKVPVVILSSLNDEETIKRTRELGASCHISKPYNREKMNLALRTSGF